MAGMAIVRLFLGGAGSLTDWPGMRGQSVKERRTRQAPARQPLTLGGQA